MPKSQTDPLTPLARQLGVTQRDVEFLASLDAAACSRLASDIERAKTLHAESLRGAMEDALNQLPRLLRMPVRKLFGL